MSVHSSSNATTAKATLLAGGFTLVEVLVSLVIALAIASGMASMFVASTKANHANAASVQLLTSVRAKIEQVQSIPYMQLGINATAGVAEAPGYFVLDPVYAPDYNAATDVLLSDTVTLEDGTPVTRTVTVRAVDDTADGVGTADLDEVIDTNTETILDYKLVTVSAVMVRAGITYEQSLSTIVRGSLPQEIEGATGKDAADGTKTAKVGKVAKTVPAPAADLPPVTDTVGNPCEIVNAKKGKEAGKKGASTLTIWCPP